MPHPERRIHGAGLGLRRVLLGPLQALDTQRPEPGAPDPAYSVLRPPDFLEVAPENWIGAGGRLGRQFRALAERYPLVLHGLSLDIGGPDPIDIDLVRAVRTLIDDFRVPLYSEHLSYCAAGGHLYELLPIPFTAEAVRHVAARVRQVQDMLGARIALENASYYAQSHADMTEAQFICAVLAEGDCDLMLDVNNIFVNAINHRYDPLAFLDALPLSRVRSLHVAGHFDEAMDLKVDTHGTDVIEPVWALLGEVYRRLGPVPCVLERDFNLPPLPALLREVQRIRQLQQDCRQPRAEMAG